MGEKTGPGETRYSVAEDGCIMVHRWNDKSWVTTFAMPHELTPARITGLLKKAYDAGWEDRGIAVRFALGVGA